MKKLLEKFEKVSDLLSDPNNNNLNIHELLNLFKQNGGEILGQGKYATVLVHPSWKHVVKIFSNDVPYLKYVRFCLKNPRPSFPKFFDKPRRIIPNYKRHKSNVYLYVVKTEKLLPISIREYDDMQYYLYYDIDHSKEMAEKYGEGWRFIHNKLIKLQSDFPWFPQFKKDYDFLMYNSNEIGVRDDTSKNVMKRSTGEFVLTDPFWEGESPYQTHDRLLKSEIDYDGDYGYDTEKDMVKGGEKFKKEKIPTPKIVNKNSEEDVPF
jgi:hypothetical protein